MKNKPLLAKVLMMFLLVLLILFGANLIFKLARQQPTTTPKTGEDLLLPSGEPTKPLSRWATDSGVLAIETNLKQLSREGKSLDLKELSLLPPLIDIKLDF